MKGGENMVVRLKVDGRDIPLNEFVEQILGGTVKGAVGSLRGIDEGWRKIVIEVER